MGRRALVLLMVLAGCAGEHAEGSAVARPGTGAPPGQEIALYRGGVAIIRDRRRIEVAAGRSAVTIGPVPQAVMRHTATLVSLSDPMGLRVLGPPEHGDAGLRWPVDAARGGVHLLEASYASEGIDGRAEYEVMLKDLVVQRTGMRGHVLLRNDTDMALTRARVRMFDIELPPSHAADEGRPSVTLAQPVDVPARGRARYALFGGGRREVMARGRFVFDPVGTRLDNPTRRPIAQPGYGAELGGSNDRSGDEAGDDREDGSPIWPLIELDVSDALRAGHVPPGVVHVFARGERGERLFLGKARLRAGQSRVTVELSPNARITGTRRQTDFFHDPDARRLVEEIRIELTSRLPSPLHVMVREHLYRGVQWTIAYHNAAGAAKEGPQQVRFEVDVPAGGTALVLYRVVYTW